MGAVGASERSHAVATSWRVAVLVTAVASAEPGREWVSRVLAGEDE